MAHPLRVWLLFPMPAMQKPLRLDGATIGLSTGQKEPTRRAERCALPVDERAGIAAPTVRPPQGTFAHNKFFAQPDTNHDQEQTP